MYFTTTFFRHTMPPKRRKPYTEAEIAVKKARHAENQRRRRAVMTEDVRTQQNTTKAETQRRRRAVMTEDVRTQQRASNAEAHKRKRIYMKQKQSHSQRDDNAKITRRANKDKERRISRNSRLRNTALLPDNFNEDEVQESYLGTMEKMCSFCNAKHFNDELTTNCCYKGSVFLPTIRLHPSIANYMNGSDLHCKNFMDNIRSYNSAMAFASMGAQIDHTVATHSGPFCYRIHGQIYHSTSALHSKQGESPKYAQLYILDSAQALHERMNNPANYGCIHTVMENLQFILEDINPFSRHYKNMLKFEQEEMQKANQENRPPREYSMTFLRKGVNSIHPGRTNHSTATEEIAAVFHSADGAPPENRDITIHLRSGGLKNISILSRLCDPLCYPLLFPYGDSGWSVDIQKTRGQGHVSQLQWYSFHFAIRDGHFNQFLNAGKLTHQFVVDAYCKTEANRLQWVLKNQSELRAEDYDVLYQFVNRKELSDINVLPGKKVILPSRFQ